MSTMALSQHNHTDGGVISPKHDETINGTYHGLDPLDTSTTKAAITTITILIIFVLGSDDCGTVTTEGVSSGGGCTTK